MRTEREPTPEERKRKEKHGIHWYPRYDYASSGYLTLGADNTGYGGTATVSDTTRARLEDRLNEFLIKLARLAWKKYLATLEAEEWRRQWAIEQQEREAREIRWAKERRRIDSLKYEAQRYADAQTIRAYLERVQELFAASSSTELSSWIGWAYDIADHIDPSANGDVQIKRLQNDRPGNNYFGGERLFYAVY